MLSFIKDFDSKFFIIALSHDFMFYFHCLLSDTASCFVSRRRQVLCVRTNSGNIFQCYCYIPFNWSRVLTSLCKLDHKVTPVKRTSALVWKISMEYNLYLLNQEGKMWLAVGLTVLSNNWRLQTIYLMLMKCSFFKGCHLFCLISYSNLVVCHF